MTRKIKRKNDLSADELARAILADIIDHPDDDVPRLIYADWLDDNGDPERAELIRLQCGLDDSASWGQDAADAEQREWALLHAHRGRWLRPLGLRPDEAEFRRGFVASVTLTAARLLEL